MQNCLESDAETILLTDWNCPEIVDREKQLEEIKNIINMLISEKLPPLTYVYGASGSGKTFVIKRVFENEMNNIRKYLPMFKFYYINCREFGVPSIHLFWVSLAMQLKEYLPLFSKYLNQIISNFPLRGWTTDDYKNVLKELVKEKKLSILVVLDEVDKLEGFEDLIYQLRGFNEDLEPYIGISAIFISNKIKLLSSLSKSSFDRIGIKIHFTSYGVEDLFKILKVHAEYALKKGSYSDEALLAIAKKVFEVSNSAREAKITLYNLAKMSKDKLDLSLIEKAFDETKKDLLTEEILTRPLHHKITLLSVIEFHKRLAKGPDIRGLFRYTIIPTKANIYKVYQELCSMLQENPKSYRAFFDIINELDRYGLVKTEIQSLGKARGVTTLIKPVETVELLEPIVKKAIGIV
jgi:Cdc6-like AAA superfamily ATPase